MVSSSFVNQSLLAFEAFYQLPLTARTVEPASLLTDKGIIIRTSHGRYEKLQEFGSRVSANMNRLSKLPLLNLIFIIAYFS